MSKKLQGAVMSALLLSAVPAFAQTAPATAPATAPSTAPATAPAAAPASAPAAAPATSPAAAPAAASASKVTIPGGIFYKGLASQQYTARDRLIGANVVNKSGVVIGDIKDLILNQSNEIEGVILGTGGILGAGEKEVGVRYNALEFSRKDNKQVIILPQATKEVIAALEPYVRTRKSLMERAQDKLKAAADKTSVGAGPALEKAKQLGGAAVDKAKELGKAAADKTKGAVDAAKEKASPKQ